MMGRQRLLHAETRNAGSASWLRTHFVTLTGRPGEGGGWGGVLPKPGVASVSAPDDVFASCEQTAA